MIRNVGELTVACWELALLKDELAILRYDVLPEKRREHEVRYEELLQQIEALREQISAYLKATAPPRTEEPPVPDFSALEPAYAPLGEPGA